MTTRGDPRPGSEDVEGDAVNPADGGEGPAACPPFLWSGENCRQFRVRPLRTTSTIFSDH